MIKTQVYLREEELDALRKAAARSGRSVAELVRGAIRKVVLKPQNRRSGRDRGRRASAQRNRVSGITTTDIENRRPETGPAPRFQSRAKTPTMPATSIKEPKMRPIAFILALFLTSGPAAAQGWMEYTYPDHSFSVHFPSEPK